MTTATRCLSLRLTSPKTIHTHDAGPAAPAPSMTHNRAESQTATSGVVCAFIVMMQRTAADASSSFRCWSALDFASKTKTA